MLLFIPLATSPRSKLPPPLTQRQRLPPLRAPCFPSSHPPAPCSSWGSVRIKQIQSKTSPSSGTYCCHEEPKDPQVTNKAPHDLAQLTSTTISTEALPLTHYASGAQVPSEFLKLTLFLPAPGPLHLHFLLPGTPCSAQVFN